MTPSAVGPPSAEQFTMLCLRCDRPVIARIDWLGREVHCPHCLSVIKVPKAPPPAGQSMRSDGPDLRPKAEFNFACPRCKCLLEANSGMSGQAAKCPTCAARFLIPYLSSGGYPEKADIIEGEVIDPQPLHAYAASGHQAPKIHRGKNDELLIECPRCGALSDVEVDRCAGCGTPFTMDAAPTATKASADSRAVTALVFGLLGVPLAPTFVPSLIAVFFGIMAVFAPVGAAAPLTGIIGLVLGALGVAGGIAFWATR